jgi:hypothetical protein
MKKLKYLALFFGLLFVVILSCFGIINPMSIFLIGAVVTGNVLGDMKNRIGQVVAFKWKGIQALRSYVIPTYSRTTPQGTQRDLFKAVLEFGQGLLGSIIQTYLYPYAVGMSAFNAWMRKNLLAWTGTTSFDEAVISWGSLTPQEIKLAEYATNAVSVQWIMSLVGNQLSTDIAIAVIYDKNRKLFFVSGATTARSADAISVTVGSGLTESDLCAYLFFFRDINTTDYKISNSDYSAVTT